jgi:ferric-dicitrate binding protein FerR (iron transport regulator)
MDQERLYKLLARELAGELTEEEAVELQQQLGLHPEASYIREVLAREWKARGRQYDQQQLLQLLARHQQRMNAADMPEDEAPVLYPKRNRWILYSGIAASIITILALIRFWPQAHKSLPQHELALFTTAKGARSQVMLPDGSQVWLNAGSRLNYPKNFSNDTREVSLEGEAFFMVRADAKRPFFVHTSAIHVKVLGTSFNVRAYPGEDSAVASLVQGSVEVAADENVEQGVILKPNEKLVIPIRPLTDKSAGEQVTAPSLPAYKSTLTAVRDSIYTETAWVQNKLAFKHLQLEKVAEMLEHWYGVEIAFKSEKKKQLYFTGVFDNETLEQVMNALETTLSFTWSRDTTGKIWIQ